jgi:hypothetical protein
MILRRMADNFLKSFRQESLAERRVRMFPGAVYAAFAALVYVLVSAFINVIFFPNLHLGVDWIILFTRLFQYTVAMGLVGAIVGWFTEEYMGVVGSGVIITIIVLIINLITSIMGGGNSSLTVQSFITALPLIGVGILLAWILRALINRHLFINGQETQSLRRRYFMQLIFIVFLLGFIPGVFARFGTSSEYAISTLNESLQKVASDPSIEVRFPMTKLPGFKAYFGMNYTLIARTSILEAGSMDITIRFQDGYSFTCLVPTESGYATFLQICNEGTRISFP